MFNFITENLPEELKTILSLTDLYTHMKLATQWYSTYQKLKRHASVQIHYVMMVLTFVTNFIMHCYIRNLI